MRQKELVICGLKAVRSRFETRSETVLRLFFNRATAPAVGDLCRWMAQERLVYRCVEAEELELISGTIHHGGVLVVVEQNELRAPQRDEIQEWANRGESILLLDCVSNVHNLGAMIRTAAFFGTTKVVIPNHPQAAVPTEATYRVAEGGMDHVTVYCVDDFLGFIQSIRSDYRIVGAATRGGRPEVVFQTDRPIALILGNEEDGLDDRVASRCDSLVTIPGSQRVESLNVSAAAAIFMWELAKSRRPRSAKLA